MQAPFLASLRQRILEHDTRLCVGVDPHWDGLPTRGEVGDPEGALAAFSAQLLEATAPFAACVKFQVAHFERFGAAGYRALEASVRQARQQGLPVIVDAKRVDIGATARAYAAYQLGEDGLGAGAVTLGPYMGREVADAFLAYPHAAVFVVARSSNPSGDELQALQLADGRQLYEAVVDAARGWDRHPHTGVQRVGFVAGATRPEVLAGLRARAPGCWLLIPGVGAQGASCQGLSPAFEDDGTGAVVNVSRGISQAGQVDGADPDWRQAAAAAAQDFRDQINQALPGRDPTSAGQGRR